MGMCVAGGAYLPLMCDYLLMTDGSGLFLAGPALVQAAIGQKISAEELGGAKMHARIAGTIDYRETDDAACIHRLRSLVDKIGARPSRQPESSGSALPAPPRDASLFNRRESEPPAMPAEEIYGIFESDPTKPYDMKEIIARLVDGSKFDEYKAEYGKTVLCGTARIGGHAVGIVANQEAARQTD